MPFPIRHLFFVIIDTMCLSAVWRHFIQHLMQIYINIFDMQTIFYSLNYSKAYFYVSSSKSVTSNTLIRPDCNVLSGCETRLRGFSLTTGVCTVYSVSSSLVINIHYQSGLSSLLKKVVHSLGRGPTYECVCAGCQIQEKISDLRVPKF